MLEVFLETIVGLWEDSGLYAFFVNEAGVFNWQALVMIGISFIRP